MTMENTTDAAPQTLSAKLRTSTMQEHKETEGSSFIKKLFQGHSTPKDYAIYLLVMNEIYQVLEESLKANKDQTAVERIYFPELFRTAALQEDIRLWNITAEIPPGVKTVLSKYTDHLKKISSESPSLLVAHAYVRYLGDLSGGQMISRVLKKQYPEQEGFHFYHFDLDDIVQMKNLFRSRLDEIGLKSPNMIDSICTEAQRSFDSNGAIFAAMP